MKTLRIFVLACVVASMTGPPSFAQAQSSSRRVAVERDQAPIAPQSNSHQFRVEVFNPGGELVFDSGFVAGQPVSWNLKNLEGQPVPNGVYMLLLSDTNENGDVRKTIEQVIVRRGSLEQQSNIQPAAISDSSGTPGKIAKWTATDTLGDSVVTEETSKVGVNLTPTATLHVDGKQPDVSGGDGLAAEPLLQTSGGKGGNTNGAAIAGKGADISLLAGLGGDAPLGASGNGGNITIQPGAPGGGASIGEAGRVLIAPFLGNVGIGTNTPASKLTVEGTIQITGVSNGLKFSDNTVQTTAGLTAGQVVKSINTLKDDVILVAGANITITPGRNTLTISATDGGLVSVSHNATLAGDGTNGNPLGVSVPLSLSGSDTDAILSVNNASRGPAITAGGAINTSRHYSISGDRVLSVAGTNNFFAGVGAGAGANNSGVANSFVGSAAGQANSTGSNNSFFGRRAGISNTIGAGNSLVGSAAGQANSTGSNNSFFGKTAGNSNTTGDNNTIIGANADVSSGGLSFATAIGAGAVVNESDTIVLGRSIDAVRVQGLLALPNLGGGGSLQLCRNPLNKVGNCSSSLRYKTAVKPFSSGLEIVNRLRPITFIWKADGVPDIGFAAEEVADVEPLLTVRNAQGQVEGVKYDRLTAVLVNAVREQQQQIEARDARIATLEAGAARQEARLAALEQAIKSKHKEN